MIINLHAMQEVIKQDFPLPSLGPKLEAIRNDVVNGKGFHLIEGAKMVWNGLLPFFITDATGSLAHPCGPFAQMSSKVMCQLPSCTLAISACQPSCKLEANTRRPALTEH